MTNMKILICGAPGSGKTTLAAPLELLLKNSDSTVQVMSPVTQSEVDSVDAEYIVWMDTLDTQSFKPERVDYHVAQWFDDTHVILNTVLQRWRERQV